MTGSAGDILTNGLARQTVERSKMSEPDEYSAATGPADEKDESYLATPNELQPATLELGEVGVTIVKKESHPDAPVSPGFHTFPGEESSGGEGTGGHPDFGSTPPQPDEPAPAAPALIPSDIPLAEAPETRPRCTGSDCFVSVPCRPGFSTSIHIAPQPLFSPTNLGDSPLKIIFAGPPRPPAGKRAILHEVDIPAGATESTLSPTPATDAIFIACSGTGAVTFRFSIGVS
jgi:hypothetical protein